MRTKADAHRFFVKGRVFSMLWAETASATLTRNGTENTGITIGRFGQGVFSQIRRFVIMKVNRSQHFVYAWSVFAHCIGERYLTKAAPSLHINARVC